MKDIQRTFIKGMIAVVLLDSLGAIASRQLNFNYTYLSIVSAITYVAVAVFIARNASRKTTVFLLALLGLFDATIGWEIALALNVNTGNLPKEFEPVVFIVTIIIVVLYAGLLGLLGWWLSKRFNKKVSNRNIEHPS